MKVDEPEKTVVTELSATDDTPPHTPAARRSVGVATPATALAKGEARDDSRHSFTMSPVQAMHEDEVERTRVILQFILAVTAVSAFAVAMTPGDTIAKMVLYLSCIVVTAGGALVWWVLRSGAYSGERVMPGALLIALGANGALYFWGVASPAPLIFLYGIYVFSQGANFRMVLGIYLFCAISHLVITTMLWTGLLADRSVVKLTHFDVLQQVGLVAITQCLYLVAFITARAARSRTLEAITRMERAVRQIAQREAMLAEVKQDLDRALKVGGPGRYSEQVIGSFRLGVLIGRGGMGEVYEANHVANNSEAAVKLLHASIVGDSNQVHRFVRETQALTQLVCPNVVSVLEVGTTGGDVPYLAMERLRGIDLANLLRRHRTLPMDQVITLAQHVANGLEAARRAGIVHRDLKPHNLFLVESADLWKILDFGVSKLSDTQGTLTQGHVVGTPGYMAPEQARGEDVDHRADVFSLAIILYRCVTGHPAFSGKDVPTTLYEVVYKQPSQPSHLAMLSDDVDRVLARGLAKSLADRYTTAVELADAFTRAVERGLTPVERQRADALISKTPWGSRIG